MPLQVSETFVSLMGESSLAGLPAFFIRLSGCNLRCHYCDTAYAYDGGEELPVEVLLKAARESRISLALVTGGEPLLQAETHALLAGLADAGLAVCLETNGSLSIAALDPRVRVILDLKCPGSGMAEHNYWANLDFLKPVDEVKFVISDRADFAWALEVVQRHDLCRRATVLISPVFGQVPAREAAAWILASRLPLRLNLQIHKYLWGPEVRGV